MWKATKRATIAGVLSLVSPGLGQLFNGDFLKSWILFLVWPTSFVFLFVTGFRQTYWGLVGEVWLLLLLYLCCLVESVWTAIRREPSESVFRRPLLTLALGAVFLLWRAFCLPAQMLPIQVAGLKAYKISIDSMAPTIQAGDRVIADMRAFRREAPRRGEVVVFEVPRFGVLYIKRIIAAGGDVVQGRYSEVRVNGHVLREPYVLPVSKEDSDTSLLSAPFGPVKVPPGHMFVLGDNRLNSYDSRQPEFGTIPLEKVRGKPLFIYWSNDRKRIGKRVE